MTHSNDNPDTPASVKETDTAQRPLLGLHIPQLKAPAADNMLLNPKETGAWFEALPMANVGETARQVFSTLVEFNRIELP
ncbi:MAG: hypothetical protein OQK74_00235, partial [Gammaproteobacteria bacterium]|nr:hypothetical protein [Gammaproteobacteria bacterium]